MSANPPPFQSVLENACAVPARRTQGNRLLDTLASGNCTRRHTPPERIELKTGEVLFESEERPTYVYFPENCVVSLLCSTLDGESAEVGLIGNEGALGLGLILGGGSMPGQARVQTAGRAARLAAQPVINMFHECPDFQASVLRFTQALLAEMAQRSICNRVHSLEQRLCRWLLLAQDRTHSGKLQVTHEFLGAVLGSRREGVTVTAERLKGAGLIHATRGRIEVIDRAGLEARGCECYSVIRREYERLLM